MLEKHYPLTWQTFWQIWPHFIGNPQSWPQFGAMDEQLEFKNSSFPHLHVFLIGSRHGGQLPKWHFNGQLCPQG